MKTIVIFEPQSGGHRGNFLRGLKQAVPDYEGCRVIFFTERELSDLQRKRLKDAGWLRRQFFLYQLLRDACRKYTPDHILILELTPVELPLVLLGFPVSLSAILFVQYPELKRGVKFFVKHWKTRLLLWRAPIKTLFLLNGEMSCRFLKDRFSSRASFVPIPDPAPDVIAESGFTLREECGFSENRKVFLFFGAISKRKGAEVLLDALKQLSAEGLKKSAFVFCGKPDLRYQREFHASVAEVQDLEDLEVHFENNFVSDERMMAFFEQADCILMPYLRPEYSSGVLALAARVGKPVLGPKDGLLGRLIQENGLGDVTPITPEALANALSKPRHMDLKKQQAFSDRSRMKDFSKIILKALCDES